MTETATTVQTTPVSTPASPQTSQTPQPVETTPVESNVTATQPAPQRSVDVLQSILKPETAAPTEPSVPAMQPEVPSAKELAQDPDRLARIEQLVQEMSKPKTEEPVEPEKTFTQADWWAYNAEQASPSELKLSEVLGPGFEALGAQDYDLLPVLKDIAVAATAKNQAVLSNAVLTLSARLEALEAQQAKANPIVEEISQSKQVQLIQRNWLDTLNQAVPDYETNKAKADAFDSAYLDVVKSFGGAEAIGSIEKNPDFYVRIIAVAAKIAEGMVSTAATTGPASRTPSITPKPLYTTGISGAPVQAQAPTTSVGLLKGMLQQR